MKLLVFGASNSKTSINKKLARYAASMVQQQLGNDVAVDIIDLNDYEMPIYRADREADNGIAQPAIDFYEKIAAADALIISFAEHNGNYASAYKNIVDWTSRHKMPLYQEKPAILLATSPGPRGAASVLAIALSNAPFFGLDVKGSLSVPSFNENFDSDDNRLTNEEINNELIALVKKFVS